MTLSTDKVLLTIFSIITLTSTILIIFEKANHDQILKNSNIIDFRLTVTSESIVIGNSYSNIITPYFISKSSSSRIGMGIFPLKLPRFIKIQDEIINLKTWNFEISNIIILKNIEVDSRKVVQKANVANLRIYLEEENKDSLSNSCFKLMLETINVTNSHKSFSGLLKPLTGHLYGGSSIPPEAEIRVIVTWEPLDKAILLAVYRGNGEIQNYLLEGGEWSGLIMTSKDGPDFLVIGNLDGNTEISYSIFYTLD